MFETFDESTMLKNKKGFKITH